MRFKALCNPPSHARRQKAESVTKILFVMRLTGFFLLGAMLQVSAAGRAQTVTYSVRSAPLTQVLSVIQQQTGYNVFYDENDLQDARPVTVDWKATPLRDALTSVLAGQSLVFDIQGNTIFVTRKEGAGLPPTAAELPPGEIHGHIIDSTGAPLSGASVTVKGTRNGTQTNEKGEFVLRGVDSRATLIISFTGFQSQEINLNGKSELVIHLKQGSSQLDETVVKGYYNTTERLNTGDVTTVKGEEIQEQPVSDPIQALEGRVPGLNIQQTSGAPGSYSTIQIRGQNSISNGNDPLYIVDGVPYSSVSMSSTAFVAGGGLGNASSTISNANGQGMSPFNSLNPSDIESITVLKDADATAIYGSRGANGVILITTKKGKAGNTKFDLNVYSGAGEVTRMMHLLNTPQYLAMRHEAYQNDGITAIPSNAYDLNSVWDTTRYTNWQKVLIGNAANFTNVQGNISGGSPNTQFIIGAGYNRQGTAFLNTVNFSDQKASAMFNLNHVSNNGRFNVQMTANYVNDNNQLPSKDLTLYITLAPDAPPLHDPYGNINWQVYNGSYTFYNPLGTSTTLSKAITDNLISNLNLGYRIFDELSLKCSLGYNHAQMNQNYLEPSTAVPPPYNTSIIRTNEMATTDFKSWIIEPQLDYKKQIGAGQLALLLGTTFQERDQSTMGEYFNGFAEDALISDPAAASTFLFLGSNYTLYRYDAIYGRIGYNWKEKYLLNITARRDGSSRFGPGKQFGNFGAIGAGWIFSKENFIEKSMPFLNFGKLRASYGLTGNDQIGDYQYLSSYTPTSVTYEGIDGLSPTGLTNPNFAWEVVKKLEAGIELGFLKDRILTTVSAYRNRSGNQLVGEPLPLLTGFSSVQYNLPATVQNSGIEITARTINIKTKNFVWTSSINLTLPNNKLIAFPGIASSGYAYTYVVGKSLYIKEIYRSTGVNPQTGLYNFGTKNANGLPSYPGDRVASKPVTQSFYGGFGNTLSYKGFQVDFLIQFVKQIKYDYQTSFGSPGQNDLNEPTAVLSRWQEAGQLTNIQRFGTTSTTTIPYSYYEGSNAVLTNASFLRLKNLSISYQLPHKYQSAAYLQNARVYLQCQNLLTITKYLGLDPETGALSLPPLRMITGGIQVSL
jgi:TonB-dependent starch-binding outer membrane protein SusC